MDLIVTGIVRTSHGVDGRVKVESTSGEFEHFYDLDEVVLRSNGVERTFNIENIEAVHSGLLVKFRGIDSPEEAKKLAGSEIVVPRDRACPLHRGEFYVSDLCTCVLVYKGSPVGRITSVMEGGAHDLLEVQVAEGSGPDSSGNRTVLVPFRDEFVGAVDIKKRTVELMHRWILE